MTELHPELWDDTDHRIVALRIKERRGWTHIGREVALHESTVRERFFNAMARIPRADVELLRTTENERLDDHEEKIFRIVEASTELTAAGTPGPAFDLDRALRAMKQLLEIHTARAKLNGLHEPTEPEPVGLVEERLRRSLDLYRQRQQENAPR